MFLKVIACEVAFLIAQPGERIAPSYGDDIIQIEWPK